MPSVEGGSILLWHRAASGRGAVWPSTRAGLVSVEAAGTWAPTGAGKGKQSCGQGDAKASPSPPPRREGALGSTWGVPKRPVLTQSRLREGPGLVG